jgi:hypothetical protein
MGHDDVFPGGFREGLDKVGLGSMALTSFLFFFFAAVVMRIGRHHGLRLAKNCGVKIHHFYANEVPQLFYK